MVDLWSVKLMRDGRFSADFEARDHVNYENLQLSACARRRVHGSPPELACTFVIVITSAWNIFTKGVRFYPACLRHLPAGGIRVLVLFCLSPM